LAALTTEKLEFPMAVLTDSIPAPARTFLADLIEAICLLSFVAGIGCGALTMMGA
jgi:hypothetical protein